MVGEWAREHLRVIAASLAGSVLVIVPSGGSGEPWASAIPLDAFGAAAQVTALSLEEIDPAARFDHVVVPFDATTTTPIDELLNAVAPLLRERGSLVALTPGPAWPAGAARDVVDVAAQAQGHFPDACDLGGDVRQRGNGEGGRRRNSRERGGRRGDRSSRSAHARGRRAARIGTELGSMTGMRELARRYLPVQVRRSWRRLKGQPFTPPPGAVQWGDLRRTTPIASDFGYSRGGPVDRYYIESFLEQHQLDVRGTVLEIGDSTYTTRFGRARVTQADVLHIDPEAPGATFVGDLADGSFLPDDAFDCVVLTQTLHLVYDFGAALRTIAPRPRSRRGSAHDGAGDLEHRCCRVGVDVALLVHSPVGATHVRGGLCGLRHRSDVVRERARRRRVPSMGSDVTSSAVRSLTTSDPSTASSTPLAS